PPLDGWPAGAEEISLPTTVRRGIDPARWRRAADTAMIGTAITSQPERSGPDCVGARLPPAPSTRCNLATQSAVGATAVQGLPSAARWRDRRRSLGAGGSKPCA